MTLPEVLLWRELRARPQGLKFRRQHPSGPWIVDFFCSDASLAIEIDGDSHAFAANGERDQQRDAWFKRAGIETLRIPARDVLTDATIVTDLICRAAIARLPLHHPLRGRSPSPSKLGED